MLPIVLNGQVLHHVSVLHENIKRGKISVGYIFAILSAPQ